MSAYWKQFAIVAVLISAIVLGLVYDVDRKLLALGALIAGFVTNGFAALAMVVGLIPWAGPILVKLFSLPLLYVFNGLGYVLSLFMIRKGYRTEVVSYRLLTVIFLIGLTIGYLVGNLLPL